MFIRACLRASTDEQNALRKIHAGILCRSVWSSDRQFYVENQSGAWLQRPELKRLLHDSHPNDVLLVEQVDRLTRLSNEDWGALKCQIQEKKLRIVSLDVPTSFLALDSARALNGDSIIEAVLEAINNMLIDLMAAMARKDYLPSGSTEARYRDCQTAGKYQGRQADSDRHRRVSIFGRKRD